MIEYCRLDLVSSTTPSTFTCTTGTVQQNIVRAGIAITELSKPKDEYHSFVASLTAPGTTASSFVIEMSITWPPSGMRLSYFLIVIKTQTSQVYVDLINYVWNTGTAVDSINNNERTVWQTFDLTTTTLFSSVPTDIASYPLAVSFKMVPKRPGGSYDGTKYIEFKLDSSISGFSLNVSLTAWSETRITTFEGTVLIYSIGNVNADNTAKTWSMSMFINTWNDPNQYNMTSVAPTFGPSFAAKCFYGYSKITYKGDKNPDWQFAFTSTYNNFYYIDYVDNNGDYNPAGCFFCFGNGTDCAQYQTHTDNLTLLCFAPQSCPLPVFALWNQVGFCPICTQLICLNCTITNRSNCLTCGVNSALVSGSCVCNSDSWPINTAISTPTQGQWNGVTSSLTECRFNCTAQIAGCVFDKCTTGTFCTQCLVGFYLSVTGSTIDQNCINCNTVDPNCLQCTSGTACNVCAVGFFVNGNVCTQCRSVMAYCSSCTISTVCTACDAGYVNISASVCQCSPLINSMANCILCTLPTACTQCVDNTFFVSATDSMCRSCRQFDIHCIKCTSQQVCLSCDPGYTVKTVGTTSLCKACWDLFPNCTLCSSTAACDTCNYTYGLTTTGSCQICSTLHMTGCEACTDSTACQLCINHTYLTNGICYPCNVIYQCDTCFVNSLLQLQCLTCMIGYFLTLSSLTGKQQCKLCMHFTSYCETCTNLACLTCVYPYLVGPDGLCSQCETGFYYVSNICTSIAGCVRAVYAPNGTATCLACAPELFFVFDSKLQKCVCAEGFQDLNQVGLLPQCFSVCGDGIIISQFEECDDKNGFSQDGCDQTCKREVGFDCGISSPSVCILQLNVMSFVFNYAFRVLGENKGILSFTILPGHPGLQRWDWSKLIKFNFPQTAVNKNLLTFSYKADTGQLLVTVPYMQELEETSLETELTLDPMSIKSTTPILVLVNKLNGINSKLIFEDQSDLDTHKSMNSMSLILTIILLLVFYLGSYVHKMIGLQTIQVIQAIYFVRMVAPSSSSSLLSSINAIQYATSGYQNAKLIYGDTTEIQNQLNQFTTKQFTAINLHKFFLLNANLSLIPILLAIIVYGVTLVRKYRSRNVFLSTKDQQLKDDFTKFQRSAQWIYDHFVFPYLMMFNLLSFFQSVALMSDPFKGENFSQMENQSLIFHSLIVLCTSAIYCYEVSNSFQEFSRYHMKEGERERMPKSEIQKLEHDQNNVDRPNYHPAYVLCHLVYYLTLSILMVVSVLVPSFTLSLELVMGVGIFYFLLIFIWSPYHKAARLHNHFLKLYYGTFVIFLVICYLFVKLPKLSGSLYMALMYIVLVLISGIIIAGFARIVIQLRFRKALQKDNNLMRWDFLTDENKRKLSSEQEQLFKQLDKPKISKRQKMIKNNIYSLDQQLLQMNNTFNQKFKASEQQRSYSQNKSYLMNKVREDIYHKKINLIMDNYAQKSQEFSILKKKSTDRFDQHLESILHDKEADVTQNFAEQALQIPRKSSPKKVIDNSELRSIKQKLRTEWVYMHQE